MTRSFAALDVEAANSARGSICSIGVAVVQDGQLVTTRHLLVRPARGLEHFDAMNTHLHGLGPADVANAPGPGDRLAEVAGWSVRCPWWRRTPRSTSVRCGPDVTPTGWSGRR